MKKLLILSLLIAISGQIQAISIDSDILHAIATNCISFGINESINQGAPLINKNITVRNIGLSKIATGSVLYTIGCYGVSKDNELSGCLAKNIGLKLATEGVFDVCGRSKSSFSRLESLSLFAINQIVEPLSINSLQQTGCSAAHASLVVGATKWVGSTMILNNHCDNDLSLTKVATSVQNSGRQQIVSSLIKVSIDESGKYYKYRSACKDHLKLCAKIDNVIERQNEALGEQYYIKAYEMNKKNLEKLNNGRVAIENIYNSLYFPFR